MHKKGLPTPELRELDSDYTVWKEVVYLKAYRNFKGLDGTPTSYFAAKPCGGILLDIGGNSLMATFAFYYDGVKDGDGCEPNAACQDILERNIGRLNGCSCHYRMHSSGVGDHNAISQFVVRIACKRGGRSRSGFAGRVAKAPGAVMQVAPLVSFGSILDQHTVVKLDCETYELPILLAMWQWKKVRLLVFELSVTYVRTEMRSDGSGWEVLADIFDNFREAGFTLSKLEARFWELAYWQEHPQDRRWIGDGIIHMYRPAGDNQPPPVKNATVLTKYVKWLGYRRIMEGKWAARAKTNI